MEKMANIYILFLLPTFHSGFSGVSGTDILTNASLSKLNSTELLTAMIREQHRICPYISLCTAPNTSVFPMRYSYSSPCCQECSCDNTCVQEGSCCPDFNEEHFTRTKLPAEYTTQPIISDVNNTASATTLCVKAQHGSFLSTDGFMMVASCPFKFKDKDVKRKCEMKFDYSRTFDIYNHIPVTDTVTGLTFKNRFCKLCNTGSDNISATFWKVWLKCEAGGGFVFHYHPVIGPFEFAQATLLEQIKPCSIAFGYENTVIGSNMTPVSCKADNSIDTCDKDNNALQTLCSKYVWPIKMGTFLNNRIYKNYACMLCNGVEFKEWCPVYNNGKVKSYAMLLTSSIGKTEQIPTSSSDDFKNTIPPHRSQVIERFFPNDAGEVHCRKGFVYDSKKDSCRLVLCPMYFFVTNGKCVPMFGVMRGLVYQVVLQADVHFALQEGSQKKVENVLSASIDKLFHDRLGKEQYEFFLWKSNALQRNGVYQLYIITMAISGNFKQGQYISVLKSMNSIASFKEQLNISIAIGKNAVPLNISIRFDTSAFLYPDWTPRAPYASSFHLIKPTNKTGNLKIKGTGTVFDISPTTLCYRVSLLENEVEKLGRQHISASSTILYHKNYELVTHKGKQIYIVCLDHALNHISEKVSYIFLDNNETNYRFVSKSTSSNRIEPFGISDIKAEYEKRILLEKSSVATLVTIVFVTLVITIRILMKRLTAGTRNTSTTEEIVTGIELGNIISRGDGSDIDAEVKNKAINETEAAAGNEEENIIESNGRQRRAC